LRYQQRFAAQQFGREHAEEIGHILARYAKYNARRKPELLSATTYSQTNFQEAERIAADYNDLALQAEDIYDQLLLSHRDAYFQLVLYPVKASANLNELYVRVGQNRFFARQG